MRKTFPVILIFFAAILLRFLYFPDNIYFSYDQARDAYAALSVLQGDLKIIGPASSFNENLFHGPLVYYFYAPTLYFFSADLESLAAFVRIYNALGVFIAFFIGLSLFNKRAGIFAAFLFAISFEQSQYALFLSHPVLAVIPVLSFYLGFALLVFKKNRRGLLLSLISLGIAIQFHYVHLLLITGLVLLLLIFRQELRNVLKRQDILLSLAGFILSVSTFLVSEFKYDLRLFKAASNALVSAVSLDSSGGWGSWRNGGEMYWKLVQHNFSSDQRITLFITIIFILLGTVLLFQTQLRKKTLFLLIWFFGGILPYVLTGSPSYYYAAGASVSLLILTAFFIDKIWDSFMLAAILLLAIIAFFNLNLILNHNKNGPNLDMVIQPEMLLFDERKAVDFIYQQSEEKPFAIRALSIPLFVNTTWSYLFEWYGQNKYGYLPVWVGPAASGYAGNLKVINARSQLPQKQFLIIEPTKGIREGFMKQFFEEEGYFTTLAGEKEFGSFIIQTREPF